MTAQASDQVLYATRRYSLVAASRPKLLFDPAACGRTPVAWSTANYRGFVCLYEIRGVDLLLAELEIGVEKDEAMRIRHGRGSAFLGQVPVVPQNDRDQGWYGPARFVGLSHVVAYSGGLLLATDFIQQLYVHMGYHPVWKYREVSELIFEAGRLLRSQNRSEQVAGLRERRLKEPLVPPSAACEATLEQWIGSCFEQPYERL